MKNGVSYWGMKAMTTFSHCWKKEVFCNPLFKDELLQQLDRIYSFSESTSDFRRNLEQEGLYMRLVTKKDKSYYVYGIKDFRTFTLKTFHFSEYRFW